MPKFGFTQEESQIVEWLVAEGETVEEGDPILEVTTDKVNMEVEAPIDGTLAGIRYQAGDMVPVTEIIAFILEADESEADIPTQATAPSKVSAAAPEVKAETNGKSGAVSVTPVAARMLAERNVAAEQLQGSGSGGKITKADVEAHLAQAATGPGKVRATPAARRKAHEQGVALADINGSGPNGRIQAIDVKPVAQPEPEIEAVSETAVSPTYVPFTKMRRAIANNLQASWQQAPHIMFSSDMEMAAVMRFSEQFEVNLTAVLTKIVAHALGQHPKLNAHLDGDGVMLHQDVHIGMAVAVEDGLIVPVIRHAADKGIGQLATEIREVAGRARSNKLRNNDMGGATFSISNLGMYGIDHFTAILNPPEVGILAIGTTRRVFVPDEQDQPVAKSVATFTLSVDHRAVDGAVAAQFMQTLGQLIAQPERLLL